MPLLTSRSEPSEPDLRSEVSVGMVATVDMVVTEVTAATADGEDMVVTEDTDTTDDLAKWDPGKCTVSYRDASQVPHIIVDSLSTHRQCAHV